MSIATAEFAALEAFHRERQALWAKITQYEHLLREHGIEIPDSDALDFYEANRNVVVKAAEFMEAAEELKRVYGSASELLSPSWRDSE